MESEDDIALRKALMQLIEQGGEAGDVEGVQVTAEPPFVRPTEAEEIEMPETEIKIVKPKEPWGEPMGGDQRGFAKRKFEDLGEGLEKILQQVSGAALEVPSKFGAILKGAKPKLTDAEPPAAIEIKKTEVELGEEAPEMFKKNKFNRRKWARGEEE